VGGIPEAVAFDESVTSGKWNGSLQDLASFIGLDPKKFRKRVLQRGCHNTGTIETTKKELRLILDHICNVCYDENAISLNKLTPYCILDCDLASRHEIKSSMLQYIAQQYKSLRPSEKWERIQVLALLRYYGLSLNEVRNLVNGAEELPEPVMWEYARLFSVDRDNLRELIKQ
jgi:hypothetical protein